MTEDPQKFKISLKILLKKRAGEYLILKANAGQHFMGFYDLPGGRINKNEIKIDFHKLIDREIKEEMGKEVKYKLRPDPVSLSKYRFPSGNCTFYILFEAKYLSGKIIISDEHSSYKWQKLDKNNIKNLFHPTLKELLVNYWKWNK